MRRSALCSRTCVCVCALVCAESSVDWASAGFARSTECACVLISVARALSLTHTTCSPSYLWTMAATAAEAAAPQNGMPIRTMVRWSGSVCVCTTATRQVLYACVMILWLHDTRSCWCCCFFFLLSFRIPFSVLCFFTAFRSVFISSVIYSSVGKSWWISPSLSISGFSEFGFHFDAIRFFEFWK